MRIGENDFAVSGVVALDGAADRLTFTPAIPVRIVRFGCIVSVLVDNTQGLILSLDTNDLLASAVRTERATLTHTNGAANLVVGTVRESGLVARFSMDANLDYNVLVPGMQAIVEVKQAATAGDGFVFIEYTPLSFRNAYNLATGQVHRPTEVTA